MTEDELAHDLMLTKRQTASTVRELLRAGFFTQRADGVLCIAKFKEKTESSSAERVRQHRERQRLQTLSDAVTDTVTVTRYSNNHHVTLEEEREKETEIETLRVSTREVVTGASAVIEADTLSDYLLEVGVSMGVVGEHRKLDVNAWRHNNREAASKLVASYGLDACKTRAIAMFEACKAGKLRNSGGQYPAVMLERVWEFRELRPAAQAPAKALSPAAQSTIDRLRKREGR